MFDSEARINSRKMLKPRNSSLCEKFHIAIEICTRQMGRTRESPITLFFDFFSNFVREFSIFVLSITWLIIQLDEVLLLVCIILFNLWLHVRFLPFQPQGIVSQSLVLTTQLIVLYYRLDYCFCLGGFMAKRSSLFIDMKAAHRDSVLQHDIICELADCRLSAKRWRGSLNSMYLSKNLKTLFVPRFFFFFFFF